jgi:hypothetical protein
MEGGVNLLFTRTRQAELVSASIVPHIEGTQG